MGVGLRSGLRLEQEFQVRVGDRCVRVRLMDKAMD